MNAGHEAIPSYNSQLLGWNPAPVGKLSCHLPDPRRHVKRVALANTGTPFSASHHGAQLSYPLTANRLPTQTQSTWPFSRPQQSIQRCTRHHGPPPSVPGPALQRARITLSAVKRLQNGLQRCGMWPCSRGQARAYVFLAITEDRYTAAFRMSMVHYTTRWQLEHDRPCVLRLASLWNGGYDETGDGSVVFAIRLEQLSHAQAALTGTATMPSLRQVTASES